MRRTEETKNRRTEEPNNRTTEQPNNRTIEQSNNRTTVEPFELHNDINMKKLIVIPLAFAAGMLLIVLMQVAGLVQIDTRFNADNSLDQSEKGETAATASSSGGAANTSGTQEVSGLTLVDDQQSTAQLTQQIDELRTQVQAATIERDVLRNKIEELDEQVDNAATGNEFLPNGEGAASVAGEALANSGETNRGDADQFGRRRGFGEPDGDEQYANLVAAGIDPSVATQIKQRTDQWSLQRLELIDQASREGWRRSDQFQDRMSELREERPDVRSELGDADYDQYLYLSGETNRVQIASIIDGSAAQLAGVENGDLMRSYANQRIYNTRELQGATREGSRGEIVPITVERAGQLIALELPRGPLGVSLTGLRVEPDGY